jgi:hypothetical protein
MKFNLVSWILLSLGCYISKSYEDDYPRDIRSQKFMNREMMPVFYYILALLAFAIVLLIVIGSIISDFLGTVCGTSMFQRSGALLVGSALLLEYRYRKCECSLRTRIPNDHLWANDNTRLEWLYRQSPIVVVWTAIVGTLVWAYGDFLMCGGVCPN